MGRAVGGSSAVGCGVFGLGGLLVGIGLTVWLGSQVLSSTTGGDTRGAKPTTDVSTLSSNLAELMPSAAPDLEPSGAALRIDPPSELEDGTTATVVGTNLSPGPIDITACLAIDTSSGSDSCDPSTAVRSTVAAEGTVELSYEVARVLTVDGTAYDCAARPGACVLVGLRPDIPLPSGIAAPLTFTTGLPPVDAEVPPAA